MGHYTFMKKYGCSMVEEHCQKTQLQPLTNSAQKGLGKKSASNPKEMLVFRVSSAELEGPVI